MLWACNQEGFPVQCCFLWKLWCLPHYLTCSSKIMSFWLISRAARKCYQLLRWFVFATFQTHSKFNTFDTSYKEPKICDLDSWQSWHFQTVSSKIHRGRLRKGCRKGRFDYISLRRNPPEVRVTSGQNFVPRLFTLIISQTSVRLF